MKHAFIITTLLLTSLTQAGERMPLATYYDCMSSTNFISNSIPVLTKINGKKVKKTYSAVAFTKGIEIELTINEAGTIERFHLGDKISASPEDFANGIEFGVLKLTAHTIQLIDFDPEVGGILEFGFLKNVGAKKKKVKGSRPQNLNEHYTSLYPSDWGAYQLGLVKDPETNQWKIQGQDEKRVKAIFGFLTMKNKFLVQGVTGMTVVTEEDSDILRPSRGYIRVNDSVCKI